MIWHFLHACPLLAHELPDIHFRSHFWQRNSPKQLIFKLKNYQIMLYVPSLALIRCQSLSLLLCLQWSDNVFIVAGKKRSRKYWNWRFLLNWWKNVWRVGDDVKKRLSYFRIVELNQYHCVSVTLVLSISKISYVTVQYRFFMTIETYGTDQIESKSRVML